MTYWVSHTCSTCGRTQKTPLSKREVAFYDALGPSFKCAHCGSRTAKNSSRPLPDIDAELLAEWSGNRRLAFAEQDEEMLIASAPLDALISVFETARSSNRKAQVAMAIAIKFSDAQFLDEAEEAACSDWLKAHPDTWRVSPGHGHVTSAVAKRLNVA
ncbi:transposase family protein [Arenibacterium sp. CAU 1754]